MPLIRYARAVAQEYTLRAAEVAGCLQTVYLGGGTPSLLTDDALVHIAENVVGNRKPAEFTIECNPDDVTPEKASFWHNLGINRVSMGIQTFDDRCLALLKRRHDSAQAIKAYDILRRAGFDNISLDLIYGLPGQDPAQWDRTLSQMMQLDPEHLSAYILGYEEGTPLHAMLLSGQVKEAEDSLVAQMYSHLCETAARHGYEHYEISNFAKPGLRAIHNSSYWDGTAYLGLGAGAHGFDGNLRRYNPPDTEAYVNAIENGQSFFETEAETVTDRDNDIIMTALRTSEGLQLSKLSKDSQSKVAAKALMLDYAGVISDGNTIKLDESGWLMADAVIRDLMVD